MNIHYFSLTIDSQPINVVYTPNTFASYGHFEFFSPYEPRRRIIISETGYRSHFAPMWEIEETGTPEVYAELVIRTLMNDQREESDSVGDQQLTLL